jgi:hypothetical protein
LELLYVSTAEDVAAMTAGSLFAAIERKAPKFQERWADYHVLALDVDSIALELKYAKSATLRYEPDYDVDAVVWVERTGVTILLDKLPERLSSTGRLA